VPVDDEVARRVGVRLLTEVGADPFVKGESLALEPVGRSLPAGGCQLRFDVDEDGQVRHQVACRPVRQCADLVSAERAARALVRDRGVDVPVGDDDPASRERRTDEAVDVVCTVRGEQECLGARGEVLSVQDELPEAPTEVRAAGFAGDDDVAPSRGKPVSQ